MDKNEFNKLTIEEQINIINSMIKEYGSATKAIEALGYNESTIRRRFKNRGYAMNDTKTEYVLINTKVYANNKNNSITLDITKSNIKPDINDKSKENSKVISEINSITKEIQEFKSLKEDILDMLTWYKSRENERNIIDVEIPTIKIDTEKLGKQQAKAKGIKLYSCVFDEFKKFCNQHKEYKMQDLISMALLEYIDKYK